LGEQWLPRSLQDFRGRKPWRQSENELIEILGAPGEERLFIEPDYEKYPRFSRHAHSMFVLDRCLRIRYKRPRTAAAIPVLDDQERDRRTDQLSYLARKVLEDPTGARAENPPKFNQPADFLYHLELLQRMSPWWRDWESLAENFGKLAVRHAWMMGQEETQEEQVKILARVAHDSIPPWIHKALHRLSQMGSKNKPLLDAMGMREEQRRTGHGAQREISRIREKGLVVWHWKTCTWGLDERYRPAVENLLAGYAFGLCRPADEAIRRIS
jgi:hypothetical protein